jgi:hypothetical protein
MLGQLIDSMDDPEVALGLVTAFEEPSLLARLAAAAEGWLTPCQCRNAGGARLPRHGSDDQWLRLVGIMSHAPDPGLAATRAILEQVLPKGE